MLHFLKRTKYTKKEKKAKTKTKTKEERRNAGFSKKIMSSNPRFPRLMMDGLKTIA